MSDRGKITEAHRRRRAVVYVRQSTVGQVERNTESAARQYALRERALELGWPPESVAVVDERHRSLGRVERRPAGLQGAGRRGRARARRADPGAGDVAAGALARRTGISCWTCAR